jgi:hypothetical protein
MIPHHFTSQKITKTYRQINNASPEKVFPLLCPVKEKEWLVDWDYKMIYSVSGFAEKGCVFTTTYFGIEDIWYITVHDEKEFKIEFIRTTPDDMVVRININLTDNGNNTTAVDISYEYTTLSEKGNHWIENELEKHFNQMMIWWEKAMNYYLETGKIFLG